MTRSDRRWEGWGVAGAALIRLAFALKLGDRYHQIDEIGYDSRAWNWASQGFLGVSGQVSAGPPIPIGFFALFYKLGHHLLYPRLGQAFIGAAVAWLIGRLTRDLTGSERAGRWALAVSAVYPFFVYYSGMLLTETLYLAFATAGLWRLCTGMKAQDLKTSASAGLLLGLAALCRTEGAPITALIFAAGAWAAHRGRWSWRPLGVAVLCWALPLAGWAARNKARLGAFTLDNHGGMTLLHGTVLFDLNEIDTGVAMDAFYKTPLYQEGQALPENQRDALYRRAAFRFMRENKVETLKQWARKLVNFWRLYPRVDKVYHETQHSHPGAGLGRWALVLISLLFEPLLILGGFYGLWLLRDRAWEIFPLPLFLFGTMLIHMVSVSQMRYRLPIMPILILGACLAAQELSTKSTRYLSKI